MLKTYDFKLVQLVIGGVTITGYGEDGGVSIEPNADVAEATIGADGETTISRTNDRSMVATITVRETSRGYALLSGLLQLQNAEPAILPQPFLLLDPISGERVSDEYSAFLGRPTVAKERGASDREFRLHLPSPSVLGAPNYVAG